MAVVANSRPVPGSFRLTSRLAMIRFTAKGSELVPQDPGCYPLRPALIAIKGKHEMARACH